MRRLWALQLALFATFWSAMPAIAQLQRIAIASGQSLVDLAPGQSGLLQTYCLDPHLDPPEFGDEYTRVLNVGGVSASATVVRSQRHGTMPLSQALSRGIVRLRAEDSYESFSLENATSGDRISVYFHAPAVIAAGHDVASGDLTPALLRMAELSEDPATLQEEIWTAASAVRAGWRDDGDIGAMLRRIRRELELPEHGDIATPLEAIAEARGSVRRLTAQHPNLSVAAAVRVSRGPRLVPRYVLLSPSSEQPVVLQQTTALSEAVVELARNGRGDALYVLHAGFSDSQADVLQLGLNTRLRNLGVSSRAYSIENDAAPVAFGIGIRRIGQPGLVEAEQSGSALDGFFRWIGRFAVKTEPSATASLQFYARTTQLAAASQQWVASEISDDTYMNISLAEMSRELRRDLEARYPGVADDLLIRLRTDMAHRGWVIRPSGPPEES